MHEPCRRGADRGRPRAPPGDRAADDPPRPRVERRVGAVRLRRHADHPRARRPPGRGRGARARRRGAGAAHPAVPAPDPRARRGRSPPGCSTRPASRRSPRAQRELGEEADLAAERWNVLADFQNSPGGSDETIRVFLARGISTLPAFARHDEEADIETRWVPLDDVVDAVLHRRVQSPSLVGRGARRRGCAVPRLGDARARRRAVDPPPAPRRRSRGCCPATARRRPPDTGGRDRPVPPARRGRARPRRQHAGRVPPRPRPLRRAPRRRPGARTWRR